MDELQPVPMNQPTMEQPAVEPTPVAPTAPTENKPKKSKAPLFIVAGVLLLIVVVVVAGVAMRSKSAPVQEDIVNYEQSSDSTLTPVETSYEQTSGGNQDLVSQLNSQLPATVTGFSWYTCENIPAGFLKPEGWYSKEEASGTTQACFITKENIDTTGFFTTGLSVNVIKNAKATYNYSAKEYASVLMDEYEKMVAAGTLDSVGPINTITVSPNLISGYNREATQGDKHFFYLNLANEQTDTLYLISFEGPEANWTNDFENIGKVILSNFVILPEI